MEEEIDPTGACCITNKFQPVTHVIFDLDGTIFDTESIYDNAISKIAKDHGKIYTEEAKMRIAGSIEIETARKSIEEMELPITIEEFLVKFHKLSNEELSNCPLMPGAERAIKHLYNNNVPIAIATSSTSEAVALKFQNYRKLYNMFHHVVCGSSDSDVQKGKPAPDVFLVCAGRFPGNPPVSKCLVFEDSVNGVQAALAAGMQVIMIPDKRVPYESWKEATLRLDSFNFMNFGLFGLPPYPDEDVQEKIADMRPEITLKDELGVQESVEMD